MRKLFILLTIFIFYENAYAQAPDRRISDNDGQVLNINSDGTLPVTIQGDITGTNITFASEATVKRTLHASGATVGNSYLGLYPPANGLIVEGNVGIGTTAPGAKLDIQTGATNDGIIIRTTNTMDNFTTNTTDLNFYDQTTNVGRIRVSRQASNQYAMGFWTNDLAGGGLLQRMHINYLGNVGIGTTGPTSLLHISGPISTQIKTLTGDYTIVASDSLVIANGSTKISLPTASGISGRIYAIKRIASTPDLIIDGNGSETIDGATQETVTSQWGSRILQSDGTNWVITGQK